MALKNRSQTGVVKSFSNREKKKKDHASALPASMAGSLYVSFSKVKNKDRWTTLAISTGAPFSLLARGIRAYLCSWFDQLLVNNAGCICNKLEDHLEIFDTSSPVFGNI